MEIVKAYVRAIRHVRGLYRHTEYLQFFAPYDTLLPLKRQ